MAPTWAVPGLFKTLPATSVIFRDAANDMRSFFNRVCHRIKNISLHVFSIDPDIFPIFGQLLFNQPCLLFLLPGITYHNMLLTGIRFLGILGFVQIIKVPDNATG